MKYIFYTILPSILLLLTAGCATPQHEDAPTIPLAVNEKSIEDSVFLYSPKTICLETKDEALISRIDKIIAWNEMLYILDKRRKQVVAFDADGKHQYTLHRVGAGRGEYGSIIDFTIDKKKSELILLTDPSALMRFDEKGTFMHSRHLPAYYRAVVADNDYIYLENETYANNRPAEYSITILHNGQQTEALKPLEELAPYCFTGGSRLTNSAGSTLFTRKFDPTIYTINEDEVSPYYHIDFAKEAFPEAAKDKVYDCKELSRYAINHKVVYLMTDVVDAPSNLVFNTNLPGDTYLMSKTNRTLSKYASVHHSGYNLPLPKYTPVWGEEGAICFALPASSLLNMKKLMEQHPNAKIGSAKFLEWTERIGLKEENNPVLFYYRLK